MENRPTLETAAALAATLSDADRAALAAILAAPIDDPAAHLGSNAAGNASGNTNYALNAHQKNADYIGPMLKTPAVHSFPSSQEVSHQLDIIKWCLAVPNIAPDSPRFAYYVSRWDVPGKIARAKDAGTFDATVKAAGPIDPAWVRLVPAALAAHAEFIATHSRPPACHSTPADEYLLKSAA